MPFASINYKQQFSLPPGSIYLNCATQGPLTRAASEAVLASLHEKENPVNIDNIYGSSRVARCREAVAKLVDCAPEAVALASGTTWGINLVAQGLKLQARDQIAFFEGQFPSNAAPWEPLAAQGVEIVRIPCPSLCADLKTFIEHLTPRTKVVSLEWVHFGSGDRIPLAEFTAECHKRNILVVVDGTQGIGAIPFSMKQMGVDMVVCSAYKWLFSPYGAGFLAMTPSLIERLSSGYVNWLSLNQEWNDLLTQYKVQYCSSAKRFDAPSHMGYLNLDAMTASIEWLNTLDLSQNFKMVRGLIGLMEQDLDPDFFSPMNRGQSERQSCIATFECPKIDGAKFVEALNLEQISICARNGRIRVAPSIYNDEDQIKRFTRAANQTVRLLGSPQ